jgi:hypothetical protein
MESENATTPKPALFDPPGRVLDQSVIRPARYECRLTGLATKQRPEDTFALSRPDSSQQRPRKALVMLTAEQPQNTTVVGRKVWGRGMDTSETTDGPQPSTIPLVWHRAASGIMMAAVGRRSI